MEHVHGLTGQGEITPALSLVLGEVPEAVGALLLGLLVPLGLVVELLLHLVDPLQGVHGLVQKERRVVHQHVDELDKLNSGSGEEKRGTIVISKPVKESGKLTLTR